MRWITFLWVMIFSLAWAQSKPTIDDLMTVQLKPEWEESIRSNTTGARKGPLYDENDAAQMRENRRHLLNDPEIYQYALDVWNQSHAKVQEPVIKIKAPAVREPTTKDLMVIELPLKWEQQIWKAGSGGRGPLTGTEIDDKRDMERARILNHEPEVRAQAIVEWTQIEQERLIDEERTRVERERLAKARAEELRREREAKVPPMYVKGNAETVVTFCGRRNPENSGVELKPFVYLKILKSKQASGAYVVSSRVTIHKDHQTFLNDPVRKDVIVDAVGRRNLFSKEQVAPVAYGEEYSVDYPAFTLPFLQVDIAERLTGHVAVVKNTAHEVGLTDFVHLDMDILAYSKIETEIGKSTYEISRIHGDLSVVSVGSDPKDNSKLKDTPYTDQVYKDIYMECTTRAYDNIVGP